MTLTDLTRRIQTIVGVPADGAYGPNTARAVLTRLGEPAAAPAPADAFDAALAEVLKHEGGFVNHPKDPGGMTNLGVTRRTWEGWVGRPTTEQEMRALTKAQVAPLYRKNYWDAVRGADLPPGLALCVFDFGVNAGPARAARYLQVLVGVAQDGKIGPATLTATDAFVKRHGQADAIERYQASRVTYYRSLKTFSVFGKGWLRRVREVSVAALAML